MQLLVYGKLTTGSVILSAVVNPDNFGGIHLCVCVCYGKSKVISLESRKKKNTFEITFLKPELMYFHFKL